MFVAVQTAGTLPSDPALAEEEDHMEDTGPLNLLMIVIAPLLLGAMIAYELYFTRRRRRNPRAQKRTDDATRALYASQEAERKRVEE